MQTQKNAKGLVEDMFKSCGVTVINKEGGLTMQRGGVFHVQRLIESVKGSIQQTTQTKSMAHVRHKRVESAKMAFVGAVCVVLQGLGVSGYAEDKECIDFYTVGESKCEPAAKPVQASSGSPVLVPPAVRNEEQKVDEFLENYGKPPREFVQFYMNPTPENAQKWVQAYQGILQKSQNISDMWADAERLYGQQGAEPATRRSAPSVPARVMPQAPQVAPDAALPVSQPSSLGNFGGLNAVPTGRQTGGVMPQDRGLKLTYYFSQICPFCARMTPELSVLTNNYSGKLEFTCVDVTPFSETTAPRPANISDKLACQWRLPEPEELKREGVNQTPTLLVQQGGKAQVKLSGYMSQEQLKPYFAR